jgi:hypothetical protein
MKFEFTPKNVKKCSNIKFQENSFSGSRVFACGQTEACSLFSQFRERAQNWVWSPNRGMAVKRVAVHLEGATTEQDYRSRIATVVVHPAAAAMRCQLHSHCTYSHTQHRLSSESWISVLKQPSRNDHSALNRFIKVTNKNLAVIDLITGLTLFRLIPAITCLARDAGRPILLPNRRTEIKGNIFPIL